MRLTEAELDAKRSFCPRCDAQFELAPGMLRDLGAPYRDSARTDLVLAAPKPPNDKLQLVRSGETSGLSIASSRHRGVGLFRNDTTQVGFIVLSLALLLQMMWRSAEAVLPWWLLLSLVSLAGGLLVGGVAQQVLRNSFARDRLEVRDGALWYQKRTVVPGRRRRIPLGAVGSITVSTVHERGYGLLITGRGGETLLQVEGVGHDLQTVEWIRDWLQGEVAAALEADAPPALPARAEVTE